MRTKIPSGPLSEGSSSVGPELCAEVPQQSTWTSLRKFETRQVSPG